MARVILICGGLCCGKTTYAERLRGEGRAVILSVDELMLSMFGPDAGADHDKYAARAQSYLFALAESVLEAGVDVILDWGFWTRRSREAAREYFGARGIPCELHYIDIGEAEWRARIAKRNGDVERGDVRAYFVDDGLAAKFRSRFEPPEDGEIDVRVGVEGEREYP